MSRLLPAVLVCVGCVVGCSFGEVDLSGKSCPCADGYVCDVASDRCVAASDSGGGTDSGVDSSTDTGPRPDSTTTDTGASDTGRTDTDVGDTAVADTSVTDTATPPDTGTPRDTGCDGVLGLYDFCDGFEAPGLGAWDEDDTSSGVAGRTTSMTYRGRGAYEARTTAPGGYALRFGHLIGVGPGDDLFFRMYVYVPSGFSIVGLGFLGVSSDAPESSNEFISFGLGTGSSAQAYVGIDDSAYSGSGTAFPRDEWVCVQGSFSAATGSAHLTMRFNRTTVIDVSDASTTSSMDYVHLVVGLGGTSSTQGPAQLFIDEVVADHDVMIPCDP